MGSGVSANEINDLEHWSAVSGKPNREGEQERVHPQSRQR
jgi:hypothetical protein